MKNKTHLPLLVGWVGARAGWVGPGAEFGAAEPDYLPVPIVGT